MRLVALAWMEFKEKAVGTFQTLGPDSDDLETGNNALLVFKKKKKYCYSL